MKPEILRRYQLMAEFAERLSYRDGWTFTPSAHWAPFSILIRWEFPNAYGPGRSMLLARISPEEYLDDDMAWEQLLMELWHAIERLEAHERLETLQLSGQRIWNPHPSWPEPDETLVASPETFMPDTVKRWLTEKGATV